jgi:phage terminase large subunit
LIKPVYKKTIDTHDNIRLLQLLRQQELDQIPPKLMPLWDPYRKKFITGGRGSAKTQSVVRIMIRIASIRRIKVLWAREILDSIADSLHSEIAEMIRYMGYPNWDIQNEKIVNIKTGSIFKFKGLRDLRAARSIKGYSNFNYLIVDEGEAVPEVSWDMAIHTIRATDSEIWMIWNKYFEVDPVMKQYNMCKDDPSTLFIECNYIDNPWFPEVLRLEMEIMRKNNYDKYLHIYMNEPIAQVEKAVMRRDLVDMAMNRIVEPSGKQVIGVDVARFGDDFSIAYERRGYKMKKLFRIKHEAPIVTAREVAAKADNRFTIINIDNGGLGAGGMIDQLRLWGFKNVNPINFGGTPKDDKEYANVATEMYFETADMMQYLEIPRDSNSTDLIQDLTARTYGYDTKIRKKIQKKEEFKDLYGRSPDEGDAVVLACYVSGNSLIVSSENREKMREKVRKNIRHNAGRLDV